MDEEEDMSAVLRGECVEYTDVKLGALDALLQNSPTNKQLREAGIDRLDDRTGFADQANYITVYELTVDEMGVRRQTVGAFRAKVERHDWGCGRPLRLGMSGEGLLASARKYRNWMANPPNAERARAGRQTNGRVASDGFFFNLPAAATLVGDGCLQTINVETYVVRKGDRDRTSREAHEAILFLGMLGGLLFDPESLSLNQKVGGTFSDAQRKAGGQWL